MQFSLMDPRVDATMNAFLVIANVLNLVYNLPQVIQTYRTKSTDDINHWFIGLRIVGNCIWMAYSVYIDSFFLLLNNVVTVVSSLFIGYCKYCNRRRAPTPIIDAAGQEAGQRAHVPPRPGHAPQRAQHGPRVQGARVLE